MSSDQTFKLSSPSPCRKIAKTILVALLILLASTTTLVHPVRAPSAPSFTFTAAGDYGGITTGSRGQTVASAIAAATPNFHIALGDLGYGDQNPVNWCTSFKSIYPNLVLVTGNHDTYNSNGGTVNYLDNTNAVPADQLTSELSGTNQNGFLDKTTSMDGYVGACAPVPSDINWQGSAVSSNGLTCQMNLTNPSCYAREYYFDYPSSDPIMRFIFISAGICGPWFNGCPGPTYSGWSKPVSPATCSTPPVGSEHYCWLKARVDEAKNAGLWVAVALHKECVSDGSSSGSGHENCESTFDPFNLAMTEMTGVDLWLDGHSHTYQRSYQLRPPCSTSSPTIPYTASCAVPLNGVNDHLGDNTLGNPAYVRGSGTVVNIIGTGGNGNSDICDPLTSAQGCPNQPQFARLCGKNGDLSTRTNMPVPRTAGCTNDYGFVKFTVTTSSISATWVDVSCTLSTTCSFSDSYIIQQNPQGDFGVSSSIARVSKGTRGAGGTYSSVAVVSANSFGAFSGTIVLSLGSVSGGPAGACPGSNCPTVSLSRTSLSVTPGSSDSVILTVDNTLSSPCSNPDNSAGVTRYTVTVTATSSTTRQYIVLIYVYGRGDIDKNGVLNIVDLVVIGLIFASDSSQPNVDPNRDVNNDGVINIFDLVTVSLNFGNTGC